MTKQVQIRRGTDSQHTSFTGAEGEISVNTTNDSVHVHDGTTAGGKEMARADGSNVAFTSGTIDGTVIGVTTPAAGNFTTGSFTGDVSFGDSDKAIFGAGNDLQIYHNGSNSYVQDVGTGKLHITSDGTGVSIDKGTSELMATFDIDGAVTLYHDATAKLATTSTGIDVTGTITSDGLTVDGSATEVKFTTTAGRMDLFLTDTDTTDGQVRIRGDANTLSFITNTTVGMTIDASQNVDVAGTVTSDGLTVGSSSSNMIELNHSTPSNVNYIGQDSSGNFRIKSDSDNLVVVTSGGSVGIGTSTPDTLLELRGADPILTIRDTNTSSASSNATLRLAETGASDTLDAYWDIKADGGQLQFIDNWNEGGGTGTRVVIDDSGNLLVGTTDTNPSNNGASGDAGVAIGSIGYISAARSSESVGLFNRMDSDGSILLFRKDGSTVGSIAAAFADLAIGNGDVGLHFNSGSEQINPWNLSTNLARDNGINLGASGARFKDLYLGGSVYLGGTAAGNALDDYEEGSWTPASPDGTITVNGTPTYVKIGKMVFVQANVTMFTSTSGTQAKIDGLPFPVDGNGTNSQYNLSPGEHSYGGYITLAVIPTADRIVFRPNGGTSTSYNTVSGKNFRFSGWYETT